VLRTTPSGAPELVATVDGKPVVVLTAGKVLARNEWGSLRVEIDGGKAALWMDGDKVAQQSSSFRPCDAFPAGKDKRNFLATSRDGTGYFNGIIDRVVVYHTVHDEFGKLPEPTRDAPRRPTAEVIDEIEKGYGDLEELNRKISAKAQEISEPYGEFQKQQDARIRELEERDPAFLAAKMKLKTIEEALGKRRHEMGMEFDKLLETVETKAEIDELRKQSAELRSQLQKLQNGERKKTDEKIRTLDREMHEKNSALGGKREKYVSERTADMARQVAAAKTALAEANEKALAPYIPEKLWTRSFGYQAYRGYYNTNYRAYIRDHARAQLGGGEMRDDIGFLRQLEKGVSGTEGWSTSVDWDWRMKQEADGSIKDLPLLQKWIKRARGPVVTNKPVGSGK